MNFPLESEITARRRILSLCQDNARVLVETVRKLALMTDSMVEKQNEKAKQQYKEIQVMGQQSAKMRSNMLEQVASLGLFLMNREDFLRLIFRLSEIMDTVEGVAFRLTSTLERKITVESKFMRGISQLTSIILEEATKMRETLMSLSFNPSKALEMAAAVEEAERRIDATYRVLDVEILNSRT
ncbi:MAG: DUF47 family protein, partial [Candidatus Bathyarchaeia archaeon]